MAQSHFGRWSLSHSLLANIPSHSLLSTLTLGARWTIFTTPLTSVIQFRDEKGPLRGCVLCVSHDGTIAVIAVDGFQL